MGEVGRKWLFWSIDRCLSPSKDTTGFGYWGWHKTVLFLSDHGSLVYTSLDIQN